MCVCWGGGRGSPPARPCFGFPRASPATASPKEQQVVQETAGRARDVPLQRSICRTPEYQAVEKKTRHRVN